MFYAHTENRGGYWEPLAQHLMETERLAKQFAESWGADIEAQAAALLHDAGKYADLFTLVLNKEAFMVDHATPGMTISLKRYKENGLAIAAAIQGHHHGLRSGNPRTLAQNAAMRDETNSDGRIYSCRNVDILIQRMEEDGLNLVEVNSSPYLALLKNEPVAAMMYVRMLFSALVDADYLATEAHFNSDTNGYAYRAAGVELDAGKALDTVINYRDRLRVQRKVDEKVQELRDNLFDICIQAAQRPKGIFTLSAPTGSGKTIAMLAFALRHALQNGHRRIILVMPYLNIIDQTAAVYNDIFSQYDSGFVLQDHSMTEIPDGEDLRLLAENWDAPIILTTTVRFFESLFSNWPSTCRRLHNVANSVILFDEAQTMPPHLTTHTLAALSCLVQQFGCSVVFATATQPAFDSFDNKVKRYTQHGWRPIEIVPKQAELYNRAKRSQVEWLGKMELSIVAEHLAQCRQVAAICNTRKQARELWSKLRNLAGDEGLFYLTTEMCPAHRMDVLKEINKKLEKRDTEVQPVCRLVSTQCIEAGVDLDFPEVWRAMGPLEAIAQAAGRCNRHGIRKSGRVVVYEPKQESYPDANYKRATIQLKSMLIEQGSQGLDIHDPYLIRKYYEGYYISNDVHFESDKLARSIIALDFQETSSQYKWIPDRTINVLVPYEPLWEEYQELCEISRSGKIDRFWIRRAQLLSVGIRRNNRDPLTNWLEPIRDRKGDLTDWFILTNPRLYDSKGGIVVNEAGDDYSIV